MLSTKQHFDIRLKLVCKFLLSEWPGEDMVVMLKLLALSKLVKTWWLC